MEMVQSLRDAGIATKVFKQSNLEAPDSVFPDWFLTYKGPNCPEGYVVICPMKVPSRRKERD